MKSPLNALILPVGLMSLGMGAPAAWAQTGVGSQTGVEPHTATGTGETSPLTPAKPSEKPADTAPIITDDAFDAALPSLDAPAETPKPSDAATNAPPAPVPPKELPDDPALGAPLGDLESFNQAPLNTTEAAQGPATEQIEYDFSISGLEALDDLEDELRTLSVLRLGRGKASNVTMIRVRANADEAVAIKLLQSHGFYDVTARATIRPAPNRAGRLEAILRIVPGEAYFVDEIAFALPPPPDPALLKLSRRQLKLNSGDVLRADHILAAEAGLISALPQNGYPFAALNGHDIVLDPSTHLADYSLNLNPGPKSVFGEIVSEGNKPFKPKHIKELSRFQRGQVYDSRLTSDLNQALSSTGLYRSVTATPVNTGQKTADGAAIIDIKVDQQAGRPRTLAAELGYNTGEGTSATISWTHRNLFPPEGALILSAQAGDLSQGLSSTFRRTNAGLRDRTLQLGATLDHDHLDTYEAYAAGINASISRLSTPIWQKVWTWSLGLEALVTHEQAFDTLQNAVVWRDYVLLTAPLKLNFDRSNDLLNPTRGYRFGGQMSPQASLSGASTTNVRFVLDASVYHMITRRITLAARTRFGALYGGNLNDIAPSQRLYAGGGGSVRGFGYQALGPVDINKAPTGGRSLTEASVELRYRVGDFGIVPFLDAGQVYATQSPKLSKLRLGAGIGARYYTGFGPLRIDLATPLNRQTGEGSVAVYVGIGQTF